MLTLYRVKVKAFFHAFAVPGKYKKALDTGLPPW